MALKFLVAARLLLTLTFLVSYLFCTTFAKVQNAESVHDRLDKQSSQLFYEEYGGDAANDDRDNDERDSGRHNGHRYNEGSSRHRQHGRSTTWSEQERNAAELNHMYFQESGDGNEEHHRRRGRRGDHHRGAPLAKDHIRRHRPRHDGHHDIAAPLRKGRKNEQGESFEGWFTHEFNDRLQDYVQDQVQDVIIDKLEERARLKAEREEAEREELDHEDPEETHQVEEARLRDREFYEERLEEDDPHKSAQRIRADVRAAEEEQTLEEEHEWEQLDEEIKEQWIEMADGEVFGPAADKMGNEYDDEVSEEYTLDGEMSDDALSTAQNVAYAEESGAGESAVAGADGEAAGGDGAEVDGVAAEGDATWEEELEFI